MTIPARDSSDRRHPDRREVLLLGAGAFAVLAFPFIRRRPVLIRRSIPVMGTIAEIGVVHRDHRYAQGAIDGAFDALRRIERTMTRFDPTSEVGRANVQAATGPVTIGPETALVLSEALAWAAASGGRFDPCLGRTVALWDAGRRERLAPTLPAREPVARLAGRELYRALELGTWRGRPVVRFTDPDVAIDLGGIAKGYAVDRAVAVLREWGITDGLVNVGGDLYAIGRNAHGAPWSVGVRNPTNPATIMRTFELSDGAVATSGDYLQFFEHGGRRYHHLLDPLTGMPRESAVHSVTVVAGTCLTADAAATAVFGMDPQGGGAGRDGDGDAQRLIRGRAPDARVIGAA